MLRSALAALLLAAVAGVFAAALHAGEDDALVERIFDLSAITAAQRVERAPTLGAILPLELLQEPTPAGITPEGQVALLTDEQVVELLRTAVHPDSWEERGVSLDLRGGWLAVRHRPGVVREVEALLHHLAERAAQRVLLQVEVREDGEGGCLAAGSTELPFGLPRVLAVTNRVDYVADYEVEIAQGSNISNPTHAALDEGLAVEAVAQPLQDGRRIALEVYFQSCCLDAMREVELGTDEEVINRPYRSGKRFPMGRIQLPVCSHADGHATVLLGSGDDVFLPVVVGERRATIRFRAELLGRAQPGALLDVGALVRPSFAVSVVALEEMGQGLPYLGVPRLRVREDYVSPTLGSTDEVVDLVHQGVLPERWELGEENVFAPDARHVIVLARPDLRDAVRRFLAEREAEVLRPVVLDLAVLSTRDLFTPGPGRELDPELTTVVASGRVPTVSGRWASLRLGEVTNYVADYGVEVAQESRIPDPMVGQSFGGLAADVRPHLDPGGGTVRVDLDATFARHALVEPAFDSGTQYLGPIEQIRRRETRILTTVGVPPGGKTLLDAGPDPANPGARLVLAVSVAGP